MIRGLFKLILLAIIIVAAGVFFLGWDLDSLRGFNGQPEVTGTSGAEAAREAREVGAEVRDKTSQAADATMRAIEDGRVTSKIKAKMALDETVKALDLNVDTKDGVVTVKGEVASEAERQRALALARETSGVKQVVDQVRVR